MIDIYYVNQQTGERNFVTRISTFSQYIEEVRKYCNDKDINISCFGYSSEKGKIRYKIHLNRDLDNIECFEGIYVCEED